VGKVVDRGPQDNTYDMGSCSDTPTQVLRLGGIDQKLGVSPVSLLQLYWFPLTIRLVVKI